MAIFNLLVGLPGSGKSSYATLWKESLPSSAIILSSDDIRQELWSDASNQSNPHLVFETMMERAISALNNHQDVIYDATNITAKVRKNTLARVLAGLNKDISIHATCTLITCSISECKRRQGDRERKVPNEVIDRMARQFETPWYNEGWDSIYIYQNGKKQDVTKEHQRMTGEPHDNPHHTATLERHCLNCMMNMREILNKGGQDSTLTHRKFVMLETAAYNHDLGKHKTKAFVNSKGDPSKEAHYYSHNNVGAYLWLSGHEKIDWTIDEFLYIGLLIQWHMQPFFVRDENGDCRQNFEKWCEKKGFDELFCEQIMMLHQADLEAH